MTLAGHDQAWREWRAALASERMHHAWLLAGPRGLGKGTFARAAAAELVAEPGVTQPEPAAHPDILVLDHLPATDADLERKAEGKPYATRRNISVDQIRAMQRRLTTRPTLGRRRAVIIDPADDLEKAASNALLKSLEEPPVGTFFLLIGHRPGRLLPTIRSRCRTLRFAALEPCLLAEVLDHQAPNTDPATREAALAAAQGSPGVALGFVRHDLGQAHLLMQQIMADGDATLARRSALADEVGTRKSSDLMLAVAELARAVIARELTGTDPARDARVIAAHHGMLQLIGQIPVYNFDQTLAMMEIGALLASVAPPRETAR